MEKQPRYSIERRGYEGEDHGMHFDSVLKVGEGFAQLYRLLERHGRLDLLKDFYALDNETGDVIAKDRDTDDSAD